MVKTSEIIDPFFSHDFYPLKSKKIVKLIDKLGYEGYGLYWRTVEFMHCNELCVGEERLIAGKENEEKVYSILNDFELFSISEDNRYYSDRILRNISQQEEKSKKGKTSAQKRWSLSNLKKYYLEIFGVEPTLSSGECKTYYDLENRIPDFKIKLPDILYTTKCLKFENIPNFNPSINWLLEKDGENLGKVLNGHFGKLKSWSKHIEYLKKQEQTKIRGLEDTPEETPVDIRDYPTKEDAIKEIITNSPNIDFIHPKYGILIERHKITRNDLKTFASKQKNKF